VTRLLRFLLILGAGWLAWLAVGNFFVFFSLPLLPKVKTQKLTRGPHFYTETINNDYHKMAGTLTRTY